MNENSEGFPFSNGVDPGKIPPPLNPGDPLNQFVFSMGGNSDQDKFKTLPGMDGVPHRAQGVRFYKNNDPAHLQPKGGGQLRCETFDTGDPGQKLAYQFVASRVFSMAKQEKAMITAIERAFDKTTGAMKVYLEWIELFTYDPTGPKMHSQGQQDILRRS